MLQVPVSPEQGVQRKPETGSTFNVRNRLSCPHTHTQKMLHHINTQTHSHPLQYEERQFLPSLCSDWTLRTVAWLYYLTHSVMTF